MVPKAALRKAVQTAIFVAPRPPICHHHPHIVDHHIKQNISKEMR